MESPGNDQGRTLGNLSQKLRDEKDQKEIRVCSIFVLLVENEDIDRSKESLTVN